MEPSPQEIMTEKTIEKEQAVYLPPLDQESFVRLKREPNGQVFIVGLNDETNEEILIPIEEHLKELRDQLSAHSQLSAEDKVAFEEALRILKKY